jgi:flagellar basal-body rod modification protein FlgD
MTIDPTSTTAASATTASSGVTGQISNGLGQDAFMQLLVTQLQHQDPTAPQDDTQFVTQLAQFSSLEKLTNMDQSLTGIEQLMSRAVTPASATSPSTTTPASTPVTAPVPTSDPVGAAGTTGATTSQESTTTTKG